MSRKSDRKHAFVLVFGIDFYEDYDPAEQLELYLEGVAESRRRRDEALEGGGNTAALREQELLFDGYWGDVDRAFVERELMGILGHLEEIDNRIAEAADGWQLPRLSKADLAAMRVAVYELLFEPDIPAKVSINEAVELGKLYSMETSPNFINGVLARIAAEITAERGGETI